MQRSLWRIPPYGLASLITFALCAGPACLATCAVGAVLLALGVVATLALPFGADPPLAGLMAGVALVLFSILATLASLFVIAACAALLCGVALPSLALLLRAVLGALGIRSAPLGLSSFTVAGLGLGLGAGLFLHLLAVLADAPVARHPLLVLALIAAASLTTSFAAFVYGAVLTTADAARATTRRAAASFQRATAGGARIDVP